MSRPGPSWAATAGGIVADCIHDGALVPPMGSIGRRDADLDSGVLFFLPSYLLFFSSHLLFFQSLLSCFPSLPPRMRHQDQVHAHGIRCFERSRREGGCQVVVRVPS